MNSIKWHNRFMDVAKGVAGWSKDRAVGVSAVIVGPDREICSTGYNGFPRGVNDDIEVRHERPMKYWYTQHAERNAIANAARLGIATLGCTMYVHGRTVCAGCAGGIVNAGITMLVMDTTEPSSRKAADWAEQHECATIILREGGVHVVDLAGANKAFERAASVYRLAGHDIVDRMVVPHTGEVWQHPSGQQRVVVGVDNIEVTGNQAPKIVYRVLGSCYRARTIKLETWHLWVRRAEFIGREG